MSLLTFRAAKFADSVDNIQHAVFVDSFYVEKLLQKEGRHLGNIERLLSDTNWVWMGSVSMFVWVRVAHVCNRSNKQVYLYFFQSGGRDSLEYVYVAMNVDKTHWALGVIDVRKHVFRIVDSIRGLRTSDEYSKVWLNRTVSFWFLFPHPHSLTCIVVCTIQVVMEQLNLAYPLPAGTAWTWSDEQVGKYSRIPRQNNLYVR